MAGSAIKAARFARLFLINCPTPDTHLLQVHLYMHLDNEAFVSCRIELDVRLRATHKIGIFSFFSGGREALINAELVEMGFLKRR